MAQAISHRKIASFAADKLVARENVNELLREIAAYLHYRRCGARPTWPHGMSRR